MCSYLLRKSNVSGGQEQKHNNKEANDSKYTVFSIISLSKKRTCLYVIFGKVRIYYQGQCEGNRQENSDKI